MGFFIVMHLVLGAALRVGRPLSRSMRYVLQHCGNQEYSRNDDNAGDKNG